MDLYFIHQETDDKRVLQRFRMEEADAVAVPADPFCQVVGSLMYLLIATRPDITISASSVSQHLEQPQKIHWNAMKRILKYLRGTTKHGFYFPSQQSHQIQAYSDADYARDTETRRSTSGILIKLVDSTITWGSK